MLVCVQRRAQRVRDTAVLRRMEGWRAEAASQKLDGLFTVKRNVADDAASASLSAEHESSITEHHVQSQYVLLSNVNNLTDSRYL